MHPCGKGWRAVNVRIGDTGSKSILHRNGPTGLRWFVPLRQRSRSITWWAIPLSGRTKPSPTVSKPSRA